MGKIPVLRVCAIARMKPGAIFGHPAYNRTTMWFLAVYGKSLRSPASIDGLTGLSRVWGFGISGRPPRRKTRWVLSASGTPTSP